MLMAMFLLCFIVFTIASASALDEGEPLGFFFCIALAVFAAYCFFQEITI